MMHNPTQRFSDRVANYVRFRPNYPQTILPYLVEQCGLTAQHVVCDVGSGTGKLSQLFVEFGCTVIGVEPNEPMRLAAEALFAGEDRFVSVAGSAEQTGLDGDSADFIIAGQAFHWFDPTLARREFERILRPNGWVGLIWNERLQTDPFQRAYDQFLHQHAINYHQVNHRNITIERINDFFTPHAVSLATFDYTQTFDLAALTGRALSSSYTPNPNHPQHTTFIEELDRLFEMHQVDGFVQFNYTTKLFYGQLAKQRAY